MPETKKQDKNSLYNTVFSIPDSPASKMPLPTFKSKRKARRYYDWRLKRDLKAMEEKSLEP